LNCGLRTVIDPELVEDVHDVGFDGMGADGQDLGDFLIGKSLGHEAEYLDLPATQRVGPIAKLDASRCRSLPAVQSPQRSFQIMDVTLLPGVGYFFVRDIEADFKGVGDVAALISHRISSHLSQAAVDMGKFPLLFRDGRGAGLKHRLYGTITAGFSAPMINLVTRPASGIDVWRGKARPQNAKFVVDNV